MFTRRTLAFAGLSAAGALASRAVQAQPKTAPITIGCVPSGDFVSAIMAKEKGFFAQDGLDATVTIIPLISNIPAGLLSGSMQIGATTGPIFVQAVENGLDLVAISGNSRWSPQVATASLLVASDGSVTKPEDLRGKRVGVPGLNSLMDLLFRRWLLKYGVQPDQVQEIEVSFPQMGDLLRSKRIDAALVKEPFAGSAINSGAAVRLADYVKEVDPTGVNTFWISTRAWADANKPAIAKFRTGLQRGIEFFLHDPEGKAIEMRVLHSDTKVMPAFDTQLTAADLQFQEDLARQFGLIQGKMDAAKLIVA